MFHAFFKPHAQRFTSDIDHLISFIRIRWAHYMSGDLSCLSSSADLKGEVCCESLLIALIALLFEGTKCCQ